MLGLGMNPLKPDMTVPSLLLFLLLLFQSIFLGAPPANGGDIRPALTYVEGDIISDTTWEPGGTPFVINGTVTIRDGATLTVLPGCELRFGPEARMKVEGALFAGGEGSEVAFRTNGAITKGSWGGLVFDGASLSVLERVKVSGAKVSVQLNNTDPVWIRNSTLEVNTRSVVLANSSCAVASNSTLDWALVSYGDSGSGLRTFFYYSALVVDFKGRPRGSLRVEVLNRTSDLLISYLVNSTGELPPFLLEGSTYSSAGVDELPGTYLIAMNDDPFTHYVNVSRSLPGITPFYDTLRFSWPPALTELPIDLKVLEDSPVYLSSKVLDRNGAGSVQVVISSPNVGYDWQNEEFKVLYQNESVLFEVVNVTLDDSYDLSNYTMNVTVIPRDDPPVIGIKDRFLDLVEDVPFYLLVDYTDEDTGPEGIEVYTDDPENITFNGSNWTLRMLYGDGTPSQFTVNTTVTDGRSNSTRELLVNFEPVYYPPWFMLPLPDIRVQEDQIATLDLLPYIKDPDSGEELFLFAEAGSQDIFSVFLNGTILTLQPLQDRNGEGFVFLELMDERMYTSNGTLEVTVLPVNDHPILTSGAFEHLGEGVYRFSVVYSDVDGDMPTSVGVVIDGVTNLMTVPGFGLIDPRLGFPCSIEIALGTGRHDYSFVCSDGELDAQFEGGAIDVPLIVHNDTLSGYEGALDILVRSVGGGPPPTLAVGIETIEPVEGMVPLGCSFKVEPGTRTLTGLVVRVFVGRFREDIIRSSSRLFSMEITPPSEVGQVFYETTKELLMVEVASGQFTSVMAVYSELDPDRDSDGDGVPNMIDAFPEDNSEWNDTDGDQVGDNADDDDDNDGFPDDIEMEARTNPRSPLSFPKDTDDDGTLDYVDTDDDGDGMLDLWEEAHLLDPLDPLDASLDPDGDGRTNLEEYKAGTDPQVSERRGKDDLWRTGIWIGFVVLAAVAVIFLFVFLLGRRKEEEFEVDGADEGEDLEIRGELDREDALECEECGEYYPIWDSACPKCGTENPLEEVKLGE